MTVQEDNFSTTWTLINHNLPVQTLCKLKHWCYERCSGNINAFNWLKFHPQCTEERLGWVSYIAIRTWVTASWYCRCCICTSSCCVYYCTWCCCVDSSRIAQFSTVELYLAVQVAQVYWACEVITENKKIKPIWITYCTIRKNPVGSKIIQLPQKKWFFPLLSPFISYWYQI